MMKSSNKGFTLLQTINRQKKSKMSVTAFTLVEILLAFSILVFCLCGILLTYLNMFILSDLSRDLTRVNNAVQAEIELVKRTNFDNLLALNGTFNIAGFAITDAQGVIEVTNTAYADLRRVRIIACFRSRGRVIGEDRDLDGQLDAGEDTLIPNGRLDSPVEIVTLIAR